MSFDHNTFISPFTWRYGSDDMRQIWSEHNKRINMRKVWVALASAQNQFGLVSDEQVADLRTHAEQIDIERALEIEAETRHDIMAEIRTYAEQCTVGGGIIHLGATSEDVSSNMDVLRVRQAMDIIIAKLETLLDHVAQLIETWADFPAMAFTHIQPAEPTTVGYRFAQYGQDLLMDLQQLRAVRDGLRGKGFKGAVGTSASYVSLIGKENAREMEAIALRELDLDAFTAATQVYPRKQDFVVTSALAGIGASLHRFTFDLRLLQSPLFGEWSEPFGKKQVGSSAMPFKRNPISSEKIGSLSRYLGTLPQVAWQNAAGSVLERTLDDSANRRLMLPDAFLTADEILKTMLKIVDGMRVNKVAVNRNMATYGPFAATERVLMEAAKAGGDRQELHEVIREQALRAWAVIADGHPNPLTEYMMGDERLLSLLSAEEIEAQMNATGHVGDAAERAREVAGAIRANLV